MQATRKLLAFIIDQKLHLDQYQSLVEPLQNKFIIAQINEREDATQELVDAIIHWEQYHPLLSLEAYLNQKFEIIAI